MLYGFGPERLVIGKFCAIAAGVIKQRYSDADVALLQRSAWWDWPIDLISAPARTLMAGTPAEIAAIADGRSRR